MSKKVKSPVVVKNIGNAPVGVRIPQSVLEASGDKKYTLSDKGSKNPERANLTRRIPYQVKSLKNKDTGLYIRKGKVFLIERKKGAVNFTAVSYLGKKETVIKNHTGLRNLPKVAVS